MFVHEAVSFMSYWDGRVRQGKMGWLFLWLIGIPVPILIGLFLIRGCT